MTIPQTSNWFVYSHRDAHNTIVYVGLSQDMARPFHTRLRSPDHAEWMRLAFQTELHNFCAIEDDRLSKVGAGILEESLIKRHRPRFNQMMNGCANAGRGSDNHNSRLSAVDVAILRHLFANWTGSARAFHRCHMPSYSWSMAYKLLMKRSYI